MACSIPATAQAYSVNVTVVPSGPVGFLTVWPTGQTRPTASALNSLDGRTKSNRDRAGRHRRGRERICQPTDRRRAERTGRLTGVDNAAMRDSHEAKGVCSCLSDRKCVPGDAYVRCLRPAAKLGATLIQAALAVAAHPQVLAIQQPREPV